MKRLLTSVMAGFAAVVLAFVLYVTFFVLSAAIPMLSSAASGSGGIGAVSVGIADPTILAIAVVSFAAGFIWRFRRSGPRE